jgi:hypothetical protein
LISDVILFGVLISDVILLGAVLPVQDGKAKKSVERRESTRLQNAAKLLRNLSKSKDLHAAGGGDKTSVAVIKMSPPPSATVVPGASSPTGPTSDRRHHPAYQSEGKGKRRERRGGGGGEAIDQPNGGRSTAVERAHSFCGSRDSRKEQRKATAAAAGVIGDKRWLEMSRSCHRLEERLMRHNNQPGSEDSMSTTRGSSVDDVTSIVALKGEEEVEGVVVGAKSILLTEDNLKPVEAGGGGLQCGQSPDLIQDLPSDLVAHAQQQQQQQSSPARQLAAAATASGNSYSGQTQQAKCSNVAAGLLENNIGAFVNDRSESVDESMPKNHIDRKDAAPSPWSGSFSASAELLAARSARPRPTSLLVAASQLDAFVPERPTAFESAVNDMEEERQQLERQLHEGKQLPRQQPKSQQFERQRLERPEQLERLQQLEGPLQLERPQQLERPEQLERQQTGSFWPAQEDTETGVER